MECQDILTLDYSKFSKRMHDKLVQNRVPASGTLELTSHCNLECVHCYMTKAKQSDELNTEEIIRIMDEIAEAGCLWLTLTGGEPSVRDDFPEIYLYAKKRGFIITLFTNATLITQEIIDLLSEYPPFSIEVTIYGAGPQTYERVTQKKGSYSQAIQGIERMRKLNLPLKLKTMALSINKHELDRMKKFAESLDVDFRFDPMIIPKLDGNKSVYEFRLSPSEVVELDEIHEERMKEWVEYSQRYSSKRKYTNSLFLCGAGQTSFHIDYLGRLSICEMYKMESLDLRKSTFAEGWKNFIPKVISQKKKYSNKCASCDQALLCDQCPGWSYLEYGNNENLVEYLCEVTRLRTKAISNWASGKIRAKEDAALQRKEVR